MFGLVKHVARFLSKTFCQYWKPKLFWNIPTLSYIYASYIQTLRRMTKFKWLVIGILVLHFNGRAQSNFWGACTLSDFTNEATAIAIDAQNNVYTAGYITGESAFGPNNTFSSAQGNGDIYVTKYSEQGAMLWVKKFGGNFSDRAYDIQVNSQNEVVVTGQFFGTVNFDGFSLQSVSNSKDIFLVKLSPSGDVLWAISEGGPMAENVYSLAVDSQDNIIMTGQFQGTAEFGGQSFTSLINPQLGTYSYDIFVSKYNNNGSAIWAISGAAPYEDRGMALITDNQNNIYLAGQFSENMTLSGQNVSNTAFNAGFLAKLSPAGNLLWLNRLTGGMVLPYDINVSAQGEIIMCGDFLGTLIHQSSFGNQTLTNPNLKKVFAIKVSSNGQVIWQNALGSSNEISARAIGSDASGKIFIGGHFRCALTEIQTQNTAIMNAVGFRDIFLWTLGENGVSINTKQIGGKKNDYCYDLALNNSNRLFVCGSYMNSLNLPTNFGLAYSVSPSNFNFSNIPNSVYVGNYIRLIGDESPNSFVLSGFNESSENYNFFAGQSTDSLSGYISLDDTLEFCGYGTLGYQTLTDPTVGPNYSFLWNTGSTNQYLLNIQSGDYSVFVQRQDQCVSNSDTVVVIVYPIPVMPLISDDIVQHTLASLNSSTCNSLNMLEFNICPPDTFNFWFQPILANENILITGNSLIFNTVGPHALSQAGEYQVTLSNEYCSTTRCFRVVYDEIVPKDIEPVAVFHDGSQVGDSLVVCQSESVFINILDALTNPALNWQIPASVAVVEENATIFLNGLSINTSTSMNSLMNENHYLHYFSPPSSGWYYLNYEVITGYDNTCGFDTLYSQVTDSVYITVNPLPTATTTLNLSSLLCPNGSVFITTTNVYPGFAWSGPTVDWISQNSDSAQVSAAGNYAYSGLITDSITGCDQNFFFNIYLSEKIPPSISSIPNDAIICPFDSVLMSVPAIYLDYNWVGPSGTNLSNLDTHIDTEMGFYYCTVLDDEGCYLTSPPYELQEYSTPYIDVDPSNYVCAGQSTTIYAVFFGNGQVNWLPPLSGSEPAVQVNAAGWYYAELTQCGITTLDSVLILGGDFDVSLSASDSIICYGSTVLIQGSVAQGYYSWSNGVEGASMLQVGETGFYSANVINDFGCEAVSDTIYVELINASIPPNNNTYNICYEQEITLTTNQGIPTLWFNSDYQLITESISLNQFFTESTTIYAAYPQDICPMSYGTFQINYIPPLDFNIFIEGQTAICPTDSAIYTVNYQGDISWTINGQQLGAGNQISLTGNQIEPNSLLVVDISNACSDTTLVLQISTFPVTQITLNSSDTTLCPNTWFMLPVSTEDLDLNVFYYGNWYSYEEEELNFAEPTTIYLAGIDSNGCFADTVAYSVSIFSSNFAIEPIYLPSCAPDSLVLTTTYADSNTIWTHGVSQIMTDTATYFFNFWEVSMIFANVVDSNDCELSDSILIYVGSPALYQVPNDTTVCIGSYVYTSVFVDVSNGQLTNIFLDSMEILANSSIEIFIDNGICPTTLSYQVNAVECPTDFPNVITPNGDGVNDYFLIPNAYFEPNNQLTILNRWGVPIYEMREYKNDFNGDGLQEGVYFYIYTSDANNSSANTRQGKLHVLR
jgi:gliding motility-associated-like protein